MKEFCRTAVFLALWSLIGIMPSFAQEGEDVFSRHWVDYRNGEISLAFDATPVSVALGVIRDRTGFRIDIPSPDQEQVINLRLSSLPLDPAMRYVITSIGYENFAVMYDDEGRP